jgi:hypothetical protein
MPNAAAATETSSHPLLIRMEVKIETSGPHKKFSNTVYSEYKETDLVCVKNTVCKNTY